MDLASAMTAGPNATPLDGMPDAWHWSLAPGFDFAAALSADRAHLFQMYALDSYDEGLVGAALAFARAHAAELTVPDRPLVLVEGFTHPGSALDAFVAIGPAVHKYQDQDPEVHAATRAVFPAYRCEFTGAEDEDDAAYRYRRAAGVQATRLVREPRPYLKMRERTGSGRVIPERRFAGTGLFIEEVRRLKDRADGFVEFETHLGRVWRLEWDGTWILNGDSGERRTLGLGEVLRLARAELYGPNLAARTSGFPLDD